MVMRMIAQIQRFDSKAPVISYEVVFSDKVPLLEAGSDTCANDGVITQSCRSTYQGPTQRLSDEIQWDSHVDKADKLDYAVAASSGVIAGLIDVFYVGELSLDRANAWGREQIEKVVMKVARIEGYTGDDLQGAIRMLEKLHPMAADGVAEKFGAGLHHYRDFSHHFSIGGLFFSILTQFTGLVVGTDKAGALLVEPVPESHQQFIGKNFEEKIAFGAIEWFFHMVSDMAGSSGSLNGGTGVPGPLLSFMKEISALPFFKDSESGGTGFRQWLSKAFNGTLLAQRDEAGKIIPGMRRRFDLRTEIGLLGEIGRQSIPVVINQCIVRGFYFCRRLYREIRDLEICSVRELDRIALEDVLPWGTPAMRRMVTVSSGVFVGVDLADAAVRAIPRKNPVAFVLRVNFVGVATFAVACVVDARASLADRRLEEGESPEEAYERRLSDLGCLELDFRHARILYSLMRQMVVYDVEREKKDKRAARKRSWLAEWSGMIAETAGIAWAVEDGYFLGEDDLYKEILSLIGDGRDDSWVWLVAMEAMLFTPYAALGGGDDKKYKGLKYASDYMNDVFCGRQPIVRKKGLQKLEKAVRSARDGLEGAVVKRAVGVAGAVAVAAATGGVAFYFAPAIAPALAAALGAQTAALSGAALTSASLAFLGGGALAVGGAGMAGGTMLIAGGGALIGAAGASGVSAATSLALATDGGYVLAECAKLIAFSEEVLVGCYGNTSSVVEIHNALNKRAMEFEVEIEAVRRRLADPDCAEEMGDSTDGEKIDPKKKLKILKRCLKLLKKSDESLVALLR